MSLNVCIESNLKRNKIIIFSIIHTHIHDRSIGRWLAYHATQNLNVEFRRKFFANWISSILNKKNHVSRNCKWNKSKSINVLQIKCYIYNVISSAKDLLKIMYIFLIIIELFLGLLRPIKIRDYWYDLEYRKIKSLALLNSLSTFNVNVKSC